MSEIAGRPDTFGVWTAWMWRRASRVAAASAAWARAERHAFFDRSTAGAFHGDPPRGQEYATMMRSAWGRP
ncbi:hypothetical protein [Cryptosporangium minutisporangium]|uniref:Uncharacterized protein n=1 Tax=Cryptosporangium minutisporangium TaxID=113569 RepID=A0ABP6TA00_9ACTN